MIEAETRHSGPRVGRLFLGQGQADDPAAVFGRSDLGETAPAAADLEDTVTGLEVEFIGQAPVLPILGADHRFFRIGEQPRRV